MFRIVSVNDTKASKKISHWNARVEKALGGVTQDYYGDDGSSAASTWRRKVETGGDDVVRRGGAYRRHHRHFHPRQEPFYGVGERCSPLPGRSVPDGQRRRHDCAGGVVIAAAAIVWVETWRGRTGTAQTLSK